MFGAIANKIRKATDFRAIGMRRMAEKVAANIRAAKIQDQPYPYLFIESIFPEKFYSKLDKALTEATPLFKEQVNYGHHSTYSDRSEFRVARTGEHANPNVGSLWFTLFDVLSSPQVFEAVREKFSDTFRIHSGDFVDHPRFREHIDPTLLVTKHRSNYYLGPHTDRREKLLTCVFNFPRRLDVESIGTALYVPKEKGFTSDGTSHLSPDGFVHVNTVPFKPNSVLIFARRDDSFHGVERLSEATLKGDERHNVQFNLWDWGRRPTH